ncbi:MULTISPECIES: alpha-amylase family protein [Prevotellaceae]|uniref:Alpha-amylase n=1 Tax=Xylanibacter rodentium TaxID=2736289 RepID=A0ABX2AUX4_9BACT|nr:alpha-amylase [Prevotella sp. PJ1A]NPE13778.1 alpha-amylase [Xylanibacter rodentium]NPE37702.1 alpha-amylase [Prevotella sp. PCJ2]
MAKVIIYQIFTRLFGNRVEDCRKGGTLAENGCGKMNDFDAATLRRIKSLGITHVWYTGVIRHATVTDYSVHGIPRQHPAVVKGKAGSPYAITDYYDIDPDIAVDVDKRMSEFEALVKRTHKAGMKVIIDFVPNHVARQYRSVCKPEGVRDLGEDDDRNMHFSTENNFYYCWGQPFEADIDLHCGEAEAYSEVPARATGNDCFGNRPGRNDWYETVKLNYGVDYCDAGGRSEHFCPIPDTWNKMTDILLFWAAKGVDGFRCDMAEMVPVAFWAWATDKVKYRYPDIKFIGEVYNPEQYRSYINAGFDWLYDKVGMYDCVRDVICGRRRAGDITSQWQATDDIGGNMLYFLENHDEQRIGSDFFAGDGRKGIPGLMVSALMRQNPVMVYAGQEFGEHGMDEEGFSGRDGRTTIFDYWTVLAINHGYFNRRKLTKEEKALEQVYSKILNIALTESAVTDGLFYDLMYRNEAIGDNVYTFLRKSGNELLVIAANFSGNVADCGIVIPRHACEFLGIGESVHEGVELLSGDKDVFNIVSDSAVSVSIPANGGVVWKIIL